MATLSEGTVETRVKYYVHRLVAQAFIGECPENYTVNHIDGNKLNNVFYNLEYITRQQNTRHAAQIGLMACGENCGSSRLTENRVLEIRRLLGTMSYRKIAALHGVAYATIRNIALEKTWCHLKSV